MRAVLPLPSKRRARRFCPLLLFLQLLGLQAVVRDYPWVDEKALHPVEDLRGGVGLVVVLSIWEYSRNPGTEPGDIHDKYKSRRDGGLPALGVVDSRSGDMSFGLANRL